MERITWILWGVLFTAVPVQAFEVKGLSTPESFIVDPETGTYYISNINGGPADRDNNGFITRLDPSGEVAVLKFIEGGRKGVTLNAPKGLAVIGVTLYVTDIDRVYGFNKETGELLLTVDLKEMGALFLNDLTTDDQGTLYVSDTTMFVNPKAPPTIFRIETKNGNHPSILVRDAKLPPPNGLVIHPKTKRLLANSWGQGKISEIDAHGKFKIWMEDPVWKDLDGFDYDQAGNLYLSSFTDGILFRIKPDRVVIMIKDGFSTPADVNIDRKNNLLLVPSFNGNNASTLEIP